MRSRVAAVWGVAVVGVLWLGSLGLVFRAARLDRAADADAIVVLGAAQYNGQPSPVLRARLDHALALYRAGRAPGLILTGGVGAGDTTSEADVGRRWMLARGVPDSALFAEPLGNASEPSLRAAAVRVRALGGRRVILVSDGFHLLRLTIVARRLGLTPLASPAPTSPIRGTRREIGYLLAESFKAPAAFLLTRSE